MYAATKRLIFATRAEAEVNAKREIEELSEMLKDGMKDGVSSDGTIQITAENLNPDRLRVSLHDAEALLSNYHNDPAGLARELEKMIIVAFNQGMLEEVKAAVTFQFEAKEAK